MTLLIFLILAGIIIGILALLFGVVFGSFWVESAWKKSRLGQAWARRFGSSRK